ncbi:hypothetical protein [Rhodoferax aquaticus]|uniref:Uncharacterized protein n=1 Tax=Rhodoferax aquaticus TaxID=2527691 RepID=A0A515ETP5_9BURK|nr:hypothetical protein [Rhodoferax aquaticus]QDL56021.1 hypothetical protein EXZ61_18565 [Rhodoferax aquaticus]
MKRMCARLAMRWAVRYGQYPGSYHAFDGMSPVPAPTAYAALTEVDRVPRLGETTKAMYREWLEKPFPRAVAVSDKGALARGYGRTAMEYAITTCQKFGSPCRLYAVDDQVVWVSP